jgi:tripartite-type tricarboxylate transporter receptor subunit TctC
VDLITTGSVGGYDDLVAGVIADYLQEYSQSRITVKNMRGAGGLEGMNHVYSGEADGLTLGEVAQAKFVANKVLDEPAANYNIDDFNYLLSIGNQYLYFLVSPDGPYQTGSDLKAGHDLILGGSSPSGNISLGGLTVIKTLDLDAVLVTGFSGESNRSLATKRGEIIGYCLTLSAARASLEANLVRPMFVLASERDPRMPEVPAITELTDMNDQDMALINLWEISFTSSALLLTTPGVPEDRLQYLRDLVSQCVDDVEFRKGINAIAGYEVQTYRQDTELNESMINFSMQLGEYQKIFQDMIDKYRK